MKLKKLLLMAALGAIPLTSHAYMGAADTP